jgi:hypothetical protein
MVLSFLKALSDHQPAYRNDEVDLFVEPLKNSFQLLQTLSNNDANGVNPLKNVFFRQEDSI